MSEEEQTARKPGKKRLKWAVVIIASLIFVVCLILLSVHFVLRSGTLTQTAVSKINPVAETFGVKINQLTSASIDIFGLIDIRGLSLEWRDEQTGSAQLIAEHFRLDYSFSDLLSSKLTVRELLLRGIILSAQVNAPSDDTAVKETGEPLDLNSLAVLLSQPPLPVSVEKIELANIAVDVTLSNGQSSQRLQGGIEKFSNSILWNAEQISLNSQLLLNETDAKSWRVELKEPEKVTTITFLPEWHTTVDLDLHYNNQLWRLPAFAFRQDIALKNLVIEEITNNVAQRILDAPLITLNLDSHKAGMAQDKNIKTGLEGLFPLLLKTNLATKFDSFKVNYTDGQATTVKTEFAQALNLDLENTISSIDPFVTSASYTMDNQVKIPALEFNAENLSANTRDIGLSLVLSGLAALQEQQEIILTNNTQLDFRSGQVDFKQAATKENPQAIQASVRPEFHMQGEVEIPRLSDILTAKLKLEPEISLQALRANIISGELNESYNFQRNTIKSKIIINNKHLTTDTVLALEKLTVPQIKKPVSVSNNLRLNSDLEGKKIDLGMELVLEKDKILQADLAISNDEQQLALKHVIKIDLPLWLTRLHDAAEQLKLLGHTQLTLNGSSQLKHSADNIQTANTDLFEQWPVTTTGEMKLLQITRPAVKEGVFIDDSLLVDYSIDKDQTIHTDLNIVSKGIQVEPLLNPVPLRFNNQSQLTWPLSTTKTKGYVNIATEQGLKFDLTFKDRPKEFLLSGEIYATESPLWQKYLAELKETESIGQLYIQFKPDLRLKHPAQSILVLDTEKLDGLDVELALDASISQSKSLVGSQVILAEPFKLKQTLKWSVAALDSTTTFDVGSLELPNQLLIKKLPGEITIKAENGLEPHKADINLKLDSADIKLTTETAGEFQSLSLGNALTPLTLNINAEQQETLAIIDNLTLEAGGGVLSINAAGNGALDGTTAQFEITIASTLKEHVLPEAGLSGSGSFKAPLQMSFINGEQLTLDGVFRFDDFSIIAGENKIQNLFGSIKLNEELILRNEFVGFKYLLTADPFQRVDFSRIQPYLDVENFLSFSNIQAGDLQVGPGLTSLSIDQNLINLQRLDLEIFGGSVMGQMFFDAQPGAQKFGLLSRISRIDPRALLPESSSEKQSKYSPLSARTAVTFEVSERLMEGEIDVTEINKTQLLQLLELVDPEHRDEQIATVRSALRFAHPAWVKIDMMSGLMNIEVSVSALPKPISIRGLPLTPLIQQYASEIEEALIQLPLRKM